MSFSLVGDASPTTGVGADFSAVLIGARAGADWAWTRLYRVLAPPVLAYLEAHDAPDAETTLGAVFWQLAQRLDGSEGDIPALRHTALHIARQELDGWADVFGTPQRTGPTVTRLEGLPAVPPELELRHVATAVAASRRRPPVDLSVDVRTPPSPPRRWRSAPLPHR